MFEHSRANAGAASCGYPVRAASEESSKPRGGEHARLRHSVQGMTETIDSYLRDQARR